MNLGQLFGEQQLRIWQLEDEIEESNRSRLLPARAPGPYRVIQSTSSELPADDPVRRHEVAVPPARGGSNRGIGRRIHEALSDYPPGETIAEIAAIAGEGITASSVSAWMHHFDDIVRTGEPRHYRYYRRRAA